MGEKGNEWRVLRLKQRVTTQLGFTLVELMAVLTILAIIIAIAVPAIGSIIEKGKKSADETSIDLMEDAGENAYVDDRIDFDGPEPESYTIPKLIEEGYLKLDEDHKFNQPENYVTKKNDGGEFIWMGDGSLDVGDGNGDGGDADAPYVALTCEEAVGQGYTCIDTPEEFDGIRADMSGKYILMADIDLSQFSDWDPIGTYQDPFNGELNGNDFSVENMMITTAETGRDERGLFGVMSYGEIKHLDVVNATTAISGYSQESSGILVGVVSNWGKTSDGSWLDVNVDAEPLVFSDITLNGTVSSDKDKTGALASFIDVGGDVVIEDIVVDADISGGFIGGLTTDWNFYLADGVTSADVTVDNIQVNGEFAGKNRSYGIWGDFYATDMGGRIATTNIEMNATHNSKDVVGVYGAFYLDGGDYETFVQNVDMTGDLRATNSIVGFLQFMDNSDSGKTLIEDITITGPMDSVGSTAVVMDYVNLQNVAMEQTVRNINVTSDVSGAHMYGLIQQLQVNTVTAPILMEDVSFTSNVAARGMMGSDWDGSPKAYDGNVVEGIYRMSIQDSSDFTLQDMRFANTVTEANDAVAGINHYGFTQFANASISGNRGNLMLKNIHMDSTADVTGDTPAFDAGLAGNSNVSISAAYPDAVISFEGITVGGIDYPVPSIVYTP